jgi:hypothetical protein
MLVFPRLASLAKTQYPLIRLGSQTHQRSRVNEADARVKDKADLQVGEHWNHHTWDEGDKASITDQMREFLAQVHLEMLRVVRASRFDRATGENA